MNADLNFLSAVNIRVIPRDPRSSFAVFPFAVLPFISSSDTLSSSPEPVEPGVRSPAKLISDPVPSLTRDPTEN